MDATTDIPAQAAQALDLILRSETPTVLFISHGWGGGVEQHIQQLITLADLNVVVLHGLGEGRVDVALYPETAAPALIHSAGFGAQTLDAWHLWLTALPVCRVHLHHLHGWPVDILTLIQRLECPLDITVHDAYLTSRFYHQTEAGPCCNEPSWPKEDAERQAVLKSLVDAAERVILPSAFLESRLKGVYPKANVVVQAHPERVVSAPRTYKVVVLGALSSEKGLALVEQLAQLAQKQAPGLRVVLLGYPTEPTQAPVIIRGNYQAQELPELLALEKPDAIWFPAQVPETYSFTLSQAMASGVPIVSADIGALGERLRHYPSHRLLVPTAPADEWLSVLQQAVEYRTAEEPEAFIDTVEAYRKWYRKPVKNDRVTPLTDVLALIDLLQTFPAPAAVPDKPIKSLLHFGLQTHHFGVLQEVARRLQVVPDTEEEVAGMEQYRASLAQLDESRIELDRLKVDLLDAQEDYKALDHRIQVERAAADESLALYRDNLEQAKDSIERFQEQGRQAQGYIDHLETQLKQARADIQNAIGERDALLNSFSWKVTRPLRVLKRGLKKALILFKVMLRHLFRPASYQRLFSMLRRGQWRDIAGMLGYQAREQLTQQQGQGQLSQEAEARVQSVQQTLEPLDELPPLRLTTSEKPQVSIVIPVYGQHQTTYQCLKSIAENPPTQAYEVILADDCSPEPAAEALAVVDGVRIVRAEQNQGFVGNSNMGAEAARGEYLVLLNNDTLLTSGALDALVNTFDQHTNVGMVGAKLLNADGSLQEAGGIIWRDGSGWNWGRNQRADDPRFNYVRDVDYCSGAVLALKRDLFTQLGGFDEYYKPAYYEDTDLAFKIRQQGLRVLYQPAAEVFHLEGISHGTDESSGVKAYQVSNGKKFYERWRDVLDTHNENAVDPENQSHRYCKGNVLVIEACMITPDQDSGSIRMLNLLQILRGEGYHVTFIADNLEYREKVVCQLNALGVEVLYGDWAGSVRRALRQRGADLDAVFISRHYIASQYASLVRAVAPRAKLIFDTVDLHFVREEREGELNQDKTLLAQAVQTKRKELDLIRHCDITLVVSEFEKQLLADIAPDARVEIVSNIHSIKPPRPDYTEREGILFVGGFRHPPNIDAMQWYTTDVLPHLETLLPGVKTTIIGSHMPESIKALEAHPSLRVLGFVEDIEPELTRARVSIAPLRYGAGVKGKVNEAMNYAIPVVATACAVEGMHAEDGKDCLIAESGEDFARAIAKVYKDATLWRLISAGGVANLEAHFSPEAARPAIQRILSD